MSDLCMYEIDDFVWDEFDYCGDHLVPGDKYVHKQSCGGHGCKKPTSESSISSNAKYRHACENPDYPDKMQTNSSKLNNRRKRMLEEDSWAQASDGLFPVSSDCVSIKEPSNIVSDNTGMLDHCYERSNIDSIDSELSADDPILSDKCLVDGRNSFNYPLNDISQTNSDLGFFGNDNADKESNDLLYYSWADIGNFEDVDRIFRNCDSTFGLKDVGNEDELGWFSSSSAFEGSEDVLKLPELESSQIEAKNDETLVLRNISSSTNEPIVESPSGKQKAISWPSEKNAAVTQRHLSFVDKTNTVSDSKEKAISKKQTNQNKKQSKDQKQCDGKRKDGFLKYGGSFQCTGNNLNDGSKFPSEDMSHQYFVPTGNHKHSQSFAHNSFSYSEDGFSYVYPLHGNDSLERGVINRLSNTKSEKGFVSPSRKSSYASSQINSMESYNDPSCDSTDIIFDERKEKLQQQQGSQLLSKHTDMVVQASNPISVQRAEDPKSEPEIQSDMEGITVSNPAELHSSNTQETSMSSGLKEISLEATSFRQLQLVIDKLDIKTKLCIRDSLYRLAKSAEQRHNHTTHGCWSGDDKETNGTSVTEGTNRYTGFANMETDTNPIDRSIAHLLFHRPSDLSASDAVSHNSQSMINGPMTNSPAIRQKLVCQDETAAETHRS